MQLDKKVSLDWIGAARQWIAISIVSLACTEVLIAATLSGTVTLPNGRGVRASLSIHDLSTPRTAGQKPFDHQFASKADGSFSLTGVPAGKYRICVAAPQANVLDPCLWSATPPIWSVTEGVALNNVAIKVQVGTQVLVHVNDPQAELPSTKGGVHGDTLSMVVVTNQKRYHHLRVLSTKAGSSDHYVIVPFDETLMLVTESASLAVSDKDGKRLTGDSQRMPLRVSAGAVVPPVVLNVGKR